MTDASARTAAPDWTGCWRVRRYDGAEPAVPTYYDVTTDRWDVVKETRAGEARETGEGRDWYRAEHPILDVLGSEIVLKDAGADDEDAEVWQVDLDGDRLRVVAQTGEHAGAVGVADRLGGPPPFARQSGRTK